MDHLGRRGISDLAAGTIVALPSITFPDSELKKIIGIEHYEERLLCLTLLLRRPNLEIVYVTSVPVSEAVIDYYLSFVPDPSDARRRLHMISVHDSTQRALSEKLLERREVVGQIREHVARPDDAYLFPFNVTELEAKLSQELGVALYGPDPSLVPLGSKSGSRRLAARANVPILPGREDLYSLGEVEQAAFAIVDEVPDCEAVVIKLNNGFSGQGNVVIDANALTSPIDQSPATFCAQEETWESFGIKVEAEGAVVEQLLRGEGVASPSVQMRIFPDGGYEVVSTHDQILGGPDDQVYLGCRFPAHEDYRVPIQAFGLGIARELALHDVIGSFGVDFILLPDGQVFLTEINLRLGGTTHPFLMARLATEGAYHSGKGELMVGSSSRVYIATDNIKSESLIGRSPGDILELLATTGLAFDQATKTGVTLHLLGAVTRYGKVGAVCIAEDIPAADAMYDRLLEVVREQGPT